MRSLIVALCLTLASSFAAGAAVLPEFDIMAICKRTAQFAAGSATVEFACREHEQAAKQALAVSPAPQQIIDRCAQSASITGQGYSIMQMCVNQELETIAKMQPRGMKSEPEAKTRLLPLLDVATFCDAMAYYVKDSDPVTARVECMRQENSSLAWFHSDPGFATEDVSVCSNLTRNAPSYTILRHCLEKRMATRSAK